MLRDAVVVVDILVATASITCRTSLVAAAAATATTAVAFRSSNNLLLSVDLLLAVAAVRFGTSALVLSCTLFRGDPRLEFCFFPASHLAIDMTSCSISIDGVGARRTSK